MMVVLPQGVPVVALQIIRDLVDNAITLTRAKMKRLEARKITAAVEERILEALTGEKSGLDTRVRCPARRNASGCRCDCGHTLHALS